MNLIGWIVFGSLAGWVASLIVGNSGRQGCLGNVITGVIGALIGGFIVGLFQGDGRIPLDSFTWDWYSFGTAVLGAVALLFLTGGGRRGRKKR